MSHHGRQWTEVNFRSLNQPQFGVGSPPTYRCLKINIDSASLGQHQWTLGEGTVVAIAVVSAIIGSMDVEEAESMAF